MLHASVILSSALITLRDYNREIGFDSIHADTFQESTFLSGAFDRLAGAIEDTVASRLRPSLTVTILRFRSVGGINASLAGVFCRLRQDVWRRSPFGIGHTRAENR